MCWGFYFLFVFLQKINSFNSFNSFNSQSLHITIVFTSKNKQQQQQQQMSWNSVIVDTGRYFKKGIKMRVGGAFTVTEEPIMNRICKWLIKQKQGEAYLHINGYYKLEAGDRTFQLRILNSDDNDCGRRSDFEGILMTEFDKYCKRENLQYRIELDMISSWFTVFEDDGF